MPYPRSQLRAVARALAFVAACMALAGCGQKGPLFLPTGEQAAGRATLTETLNPAAKPAPPASAPPSGIAAPIRTP